MTRPNPLRDELTPGAKAELAVEFAELRRLFPPVRLEHIGKWTVAVPLDRYKPWTQNRRGW